MATPTDRIAGTTDGAAGRSIARSMRLLQFGDSMLPIGTFAFSNALESAIQEGVVHDVDSLRAFVRTATRQAAQGDAIALLHAHRGALAGDRETAVAADRAVFERKLNEEPRSMSVRMGKKLAEVARRVLASPLVDGWIADIEANLTPGTFPATLGLVVAELGLPEEDAFAIHQYGTAFMILSAALRLMRVDHLDVQAILFEVDQAAPADHAAIARASLEQMAMFTPTVDVLAAIHVKSHVRLFMS